MLYNPSRFLEPVAPYTFLPFIDGPRNCLGQHLSLLESKVMSELFLSAFCKDPELALKSAQPVGESLQLELSSLPISVACATCRRVTSMVRLKPPTSVPATIEA